ncbi:2OG-Fe(II) oxygenase [Marinicella litoralis]|uniref:2-oxoglutarate-Fe(II)-dependent oxygenase superfamily protein n=1 Tax=Marinicella litoralis TaxID=644220 RepID=A0A4R6XYY3_9GAMM|nr:2OG-Fe(II) oxygenase [Marinicella litoralis]TDR23849.1 2-oxoglutarate-Fe(II)-dependent oxygenase superfamily protein [Marinicella litoralis]
MIEQLINHSTLNQLDSIQQSFDTAKPFKHVVIDDFFTTSFCQKLLDDFPDFDNKDAIDENKTLGKKAVVQTVSQISHSYRSLDLMFQSPEFLAMISQITGIDDLLYDPHYIGGGTHNNLDGQELDPHVDFTHHPITNHHRRLNLIVYLNHEWDASWGGNLEFHKNPRLDPDEDEITRVIPLFNRAVIFETHNHSWHGFPPIGLPDDKQGVSRKSFALYYYTNKRQQSIDPHSTIYVERHLPPDFLVNKVLTDKEINQIKASVARRDQHLARLYKTITAQTIEINQLKTDVLRYKTLGANPSKQVELIERQMALLSYDETRLLNRVQELENSSSWKMTAPLRKLRRWLGRSV